MSRDVAVVYPFFRNFIINLVRFYAMSKKQCIKCKSLFRSLYLELKLLLIEMYIVILVV